MVNTEFYVDHKGLNKRIKKTYKDLPRAKTLCDDCYEKSNKKYSPNR